MSYSFDEPVDELLNAIGMCPQTHVTLTGRPPEWVVSKAPPNCRITGWLDRAEYDDLLRSARGILCLTSREHTMQQGGWEGVEYGLPMILSATEALQSYFNQGGVIFVAGHTAEDLSEALAKLWSDHDRLAAEILEAQPVLLDRARRDIEALRSFLDLPTELASDPAS